MGLDVLFRGHPRYCTSSAAPSDRILGLRDSSRLIPFVTNRGSPGPDSAASDGCTRTSLCASTVHSPCRGRPREPRQGIPTQAPRTRQTTSASAHPASIPITKTLSARCGLICSTGIPLDPPRGTPTPTETIDQPLLRCSSSVTLSLVRNSVMQRLSVPWTEPHMSSSVVSDHENTLGSTLLDLLNRHPLEPSRGTPTETRPTETFNRDPPLLRCSSSVTLPSVRNPSNSTPATPRLHHLHARPPPASSRPMRTNPRATELRSREHTDSSSTSARP